MEKRSTATATMIRAPWECLQSLGFWFYTSQLRHTHRYLHICLSISLDHLYHLYLRRELAESTLVSLSHGLCDLAHPFLVFFMIFHADLQKVNLENLPWYFFFPLFVFFFEIFTTGTCRTYPGISFFANLCNIFWSLLPGYFCSRSILKNRWALFEQI
mgnify:CR=1 FL=1